MAMKWCLAHGIYSEEDAKKIFSKLEKGVTSSSAKRPLPSSSTKKTPSKKIKTSAESDGESETEEMVVKKEELIVKTE
jgi:hypothetical protein